MKDIKTMKSRMIWLLLSVLLAIAMAFAQTPASAQVECRNVQAGNTTDTDNDGFSDYEECNGITLADGTPFNSLDPNKKDLFVILIPADPSYLPSEPLEYVYGLGINVHKIYPEQASNDPDYRNDRIVSPGSVYQQKAVRVAESLVTEIDPHILGISFEGTPNSRDNAVVYTAKIINHVNSVYASANAGQPPSDIISRYIKQTIAHEIGHVIGPLAPVSLRDQERYGGYHYKSGTNVIMDQSVYYTVKGNKVTFYIGTTYTSLDKEGIKLK
ncbi:MAG: hypothetical protein FJ110_02685 [Deltaproteobacteria bacterium]|nr:hypothetical protein [Deltaproteobacteria bacterium]